MTPLTDEEKHALQNTSWKKWALDLIERRFCNVHDGESYAILALDEYPYLITLYGREGWKEKLIRAIEKEGYP